VTTQSATAVGVSPSDPPTVRLLDARSADLDADGLRAWARQLTAESGAAHVARSYRFPFALVAWHGDAVGVDIERVETCGEAFADLICTASERARLPGIAHADGYLTSLWCSKEALTKALGDALSYDPRRLDSPMFWPDARSGPWRAIRLAPVAGHVGWLCWRATPGPDV